MATVDEPQMALVPVPATDLGARIVELAANPQLDVEKLKALIGMKREADQEIAKGQFNAALVSAQMEMRPIAADAYNLQTKSKYATYAKLDRALRPIYNRHGFGLSFNTADCPREQYVRVVCTVSHAGGYARDYHIDIPADGKGAKGGDVMTLTHAVGAGASYGMRYLLKMIFNVAVGEDDKDGNAPPPKPVVDPKGFTEWATDLEVVAKEQGLDALKAAWTKSRPDFRTHMTNHYGDKWDALKATAQKAVRA